jgi:geranylgeranyl diphosphate synthase type I
VTTLAVPEVLTESRRHLASAETAYELRPLLDYLLLRDL